MKQAPVLHVLDHALPQVSGYSVRSHNLLRHLHQAGVPLHIVASSHEAGGALEDVIDGLTYTHLPLRLPDSFQTPISLARRIAALARHLQREIRDRGIAVIHAHSPAPNGIAALWAARRTGIPVVYEMRALWEDAAVARGRGDERSLRYRATRQLESWLLRRVDAVAAIAKPLVAEVVGRGVPADRVFHTPNAIDSGLFRPTTADAELLARHQLSGATVIGFIGYFFAYEGVEDLVRAFALASPRLPSAKLLIVGGGEGQESVRELVRRLGIDAAVVFVGPVPYAAVQSYYSLCDVLVYPRRSSRLTELTTPLKPLEAMAMGKPIIVSDVEGLRTLVSADETGLTFPHSNYEGLADALIAVGGDAALRARLGTNARQAAVEQYDWARVVAVYQDIYRRLLSSGSTEVVQSAPASRGEPV